ncbi:MAG: hypothetical protein EYC69_09990 [Bacteroidetes bacterium]|nr:MAG: hypothetical protein EYC69_09990 [Bacteroidota bacterium]
MKNGLYLYAKFILLVFLQFICLRSYGQINLNMPWADVTYNDSIDYYQYVQKMDSTVGFIQSLNDYDEESNESGIREYSRWKLFWDTRVSFDSDLGIVNTVNVRREARILGGGDPNGTESIVSICDGDPLFPSEWSSISPINYSSQHLGFIQSVSLDPNNTDVMFAGTEYGGLYRTGDGGLTWSNRTNSLRIPGLGINDIYVSPLNSQVVWAAPDLRDMGLGY